MAKPSKKAIVTALLDAHGRTYAAEIGIDPAKNTPSPLFRLLCASLLFSARISADIAVRASKALADQGWTTAQKLAESTWDERARTLNEAGYARYDERTATMLGETADLIVERYGGDLRKLRKEAGRDPDEERHLLKCCKGIGDVGVDIFFREVQGAWGELHPFLDKRARDSAQALGLGDDPRALARLVDKSDFPRLASALVRPGHTPPRARGLAAAA
jgi:endonuclease III